MASTRRSRFWVGLCALMFFACVPGCLNPYVRMPNFAQPGTAAQQRADAERFDPYPDPNMGPAIDGGRPLGFTKPMSDIEWSRSYGGRPRGMVPAGVPVIPTSPGAFSGTVPSTAPVVTNPFPATTTPPPTFTPYTVPVTAPTTQTVPMVPTTPTTPFIPSPTAPRQVQPRAPY